MATEQGHSQEFDLDKTDRLPILTGQFLVSDSVDDTLNREAPSASYLESTAERPMLTEGHALTNLATEFVRPPAIDLPSLAESLRSVEERIAHQQSEYEMLSRSYEKARDSEEVSKSRAVQLDADLTSARALIETEQTRNREQEKSLAERTAFFEAARTRAEEALRESERHQSESRLLRDTLAARDATISQTLHSLGERDAQLTALQQEHSKVQQSLEIRGRSHAQLEADLDATKHAVHELIAQLTVSKESVADLAAKVKRSDAEFNSVRAELGATRMQAATYLESLRNHEYRRGFEENLFLEMDAKVGIADAGHNALKAECERLLAQAAQQDEKIAAQSSAIEKLQSNVTAQTATLAKQAHDLKQNELARADLNQRLAVTEAELQQVSANLAEHQVSLQEARAAASTDSLRMSELLKSAEQALSEQAGQLALLRSEHGAAIASLQSEHIATMSHLQDQHTSQMNQVQSSHMAAATRIEAEHAAELEGLKAMHSSYVVEAEARAEQREQEMAVLMAHLREARRPLEPIEAEVQRLTEALTIKTTAFDELDAEARKLRASLERTKGALEEREFLIRRLERSESNNANVLGRIQTSMERLGSGRIMPAAIANLPDCVAELVRIDGGRSTNHTLGRRTRIGRGAGCELQVESSSVSRHHALIVVGPRETIVEDLNSTNGVILNGRKITRAFLTDGDTLIVGEVQFRYVAKASNRTSAQAPLETTSGELI